MKELKESGANSLKGVLTAAPGTPPQPIELLAATNFHVELRAHLSPNAELIISRPSQNLSRNCSSEPDSAPITPRKCPDEAAHSNTTTSWRLASHSVTVSRRGRRVGADSLVKLARLKRAASTLSTGGLATLAVGSPDAFNLTGSLSPAAGLARLPSATQFDDTSDPQIVLDLIDDFVRKGMSWKGHSLAPKALPILELLERTRRLLMDEPRLVHVATPAYLFGDIHGNIEDLKAFEDNFWRHGPSVCPASLVFLGDYVDRGECGVECILYLICQKLLAPHKVTLLRGNHEVAEVNKRYGFREECQVKFGPVAKQMWEAFNLVFDCLPLAAIVGNSVFAVHGGIPGPNIVGGDGQENWRVLEKIQMAPCPLRDLRSSPLAFDLLWSDPSEDEFGGFFTPNEERGMGHKFSSTALEEFLAANNMAWVVRAHQYQAHLGFKVQKRGKLLTVFSSSGYMDKNEAACVLMADGKIRVIRLSGIAGETERHDCDQEERGGKNDCCLS